MLFDNQEKQLSGAKHVKLDENNFESQPHCLCYYCVPN